MSKFLRSRLMSVLFNPVRCNGDQAGTLGSGAGKGGGAGGSIRESGGAFGKMEQAHEEQYFRKLQQEQIQKLKEDMERQKQLVERLKAELEKQKGKLGNIESSKSNENSNQCG
ncbi:ATPase inhibitor, mitochondrial-like [Uloborus diversus]|uniref:ATPase inhibitor, mitochondrial-like n=1 Tax=Uloborus diversus TaxID=327109 RepID=UPI002409A5B9|nr:ATPase inhibitor, mitochondrial-like [Uloborus diversus]